MLVIGHRGALHEAVENSLESFEKAIDAGSDRVELDVQLTKDGQVVIMHDNNVERICGKPGLISDLTMEQLATFKLKNGEKIPTLNDVIDLCIEKLEINVEIKGASLKLSRATLDILRQVNRDHRFIVSCFEPEPLDFFLEQRPTIRRACLVEVMPHWPDLASRHPLHFMNRVRTNIIHPWAPLVDQNFVDQAKSRDWIIYPYCSAKGEEDEDRLGLWTSFKALGVDGLCTNYPREMRAWVEEIK